jgi:short subunit fatty acids transporter
MWPDANFAARQADDVHKMPEPRTVFAFVTLLLGLLGVALFGIGLVAVWGGIWSAIGFVICVGLVAVAGSELAPSALSRRTGGVHKIQ